MPGPRTPNIPTAPPVLSEHRLRRDRNLRLVLMVALSGFVIAGGAGVFGARTGVVTGEAGGYRLSIQYPSVTRPGLAVRWELKLWHPGGFAGPIHIETSLGYFDLFDFNNLQALPSSVLNQGDRALWVLDPPHGDTLVVDLDATLSPNVQKGQAATTSLLVRGVPVVSVHYETRVMP